MNKLFLEIGFTDKDKQAKYGTEFLFVCKLYSKYISDIKIENLLKIAIQLVNSKDEANVIPTDKLIKVCVIYKYFELQNLDNEPKEINRYNIILDFILDTILEVSEKYSWPVEGFKNAYPEVIKSDFKNESVVLAPKLSKDRRYSAALIAVRNKEYSSLFIELLNKKNEEAKRFEVIKLVFYEDDYPSITKNLKWINKDALIISNEDEEINFKFWVKSGAIKLFLTPKIHNEKYLRDELKLMNPEISQTERLEIIDKRIAR